METWRRQHGDQNETCNLIYFTMEVAYKKNNKSETGVTLLFKMRLAI